MTEVSKKPTFEENLTHLETLVKELEEGDLPLEESIKTFEKGVKLVRECQTQLDNAKLRIENINAKNDL